MTRHELLDVAKSCAMRFGLASPAGVFLQVLAVCFVSEAAQEAAALSAYWSAGPESIDEQLCWGDCEMAAYSANASDAAAAFNKLSRCLPLPSDPAGRLIKTLLHSPQSVR